ncbi:MAG: hypothetical protein ACHP9S_03485 [Terriglobales bacterium]
MNRKHAIFVAILMAVLPLFALAQDQDDKGRDWGAYTVRQSIELGGHIADVEGNQQMYSTFVNLATGPRILGQELSMQSKNHAGVLFDNLYMSSFGFGGDPENLARLRITKNKWYNFVGLYRRDKNFFDYNLFSNPLNLNAGVTTCGGPVGGPPTCTNAVNPQNLPWYSNSPHLQATTRNMGDFSLTLLPESAISFRLGYARNNTHGTMDTSFGTPFTTLMTENSGWRSDRYQFGADLKPLPRTTISLDVFYEHDKNDLAYRNVPGFVLGAGGLPVDIGLTFLPSAVNPGCITSAGPPPVLGLTSTCTGATLGFIKSGNFRTNIPTGQLSFASNYFRKLDITASGTYSSSSSDFLNFREFNYGTAPTLLTGPVSNGRVSTNADLGVTYHISKQWSVSDKFRWMNWRQPGSLNLTQFNCSHAAAPAPTLLTAFLNPCSQAASLLALINAVNAGATVAGNATSGNFQTITSYGTLIGERSYFNTAKLNWTPSRRFSAYAGYRYGRRELNEGTALSAAGAPFSPPTNMFLQNVTTITNVCQLTATPAACATASLSTAAGVDTQQINQHTLLFGFVFRPIQAWRINGDVEALSADNAFTDISPRHQQRVRVYSNYKLNRWMSVNGGAHFVGTRNDYAPSEVVENTTTPLFPVAGALLPFYGHKDHWRYYTLGMSLNPNSKFTFDFGWTLLDQGIKSAACMPLQSTAFAPAGSLPAGLTAPTAANTCATGTQVLPLLLDYQERTNSGYANISFRPAKHVTLNLGYEVTGDNGRTNWLRSDNGASLQVVGDAFGNVPAIAGNSVTCAAGVTQVTSAAGVNIGCAYPGPFADQPLGPQAINWHKAHLGIAFDVAKGVQFKGLWNYYDYNSKDEVPSLARLNVTAPRDFHANVGTISLKYTF